MPMAKAKAMARSADWRSRGAEPARCEAMLIDV
jgi:hypothetical protein